MSSISKKEALESSETLGTVLHAMVHARYGDDVYDWDPLTVEMELRDDYGAETSVESMNRCAAMQVVMGSDAFFKRLDAFLGVCNALSSGAPFFSVFDPVTTEEAAWALLEVSLNRDMLPFSRPIRVYLKQILAADGYSAEDMYPAPFRLVFDRANVPADVRAEVKLSTNNDNVTQYLDAQLASMSEQFGRIDSMKYLDNLLMVKELDKVVTEFTAEAGND